MHINTYYIDALCTYGCSLTATKDLGTADSDKLKTYGLSGSDFDHLLHQ